MADLFVAVAGASAPLLGLELLVVSGLATAVVFRLPSRRTDSAGDEPMQWRVSRLGLRLMGTVPLVIGALSVLVEAGGGLYWIAAGIVLAICGAVANAWVLLVEILR